MNTMKIIKRSVAVLLLLLLVLMDAMAQLPLAMILVFGAVLCIIVRDGTRNRLASKDLLAFKIMAPACAILLSVALCVSGHFVTDRRAKEVIATIEKFKADHGRYPDSLDELIPDYYTERPAINPSPVLSDFLHYEHDESAGVHRLLWMIHFATTRIHTFETAKDKTMG